MQITDRCRCGLRYRKHLETQANVRKRMSIATLCAEGSEVTVKSASPAYTTSMHREEAAADAAKPDAAQEAARPAVAGRVSPLGMS